MRVGRGMLNSGLETKTLPPLKCVKEIDQLETKLWEGKAVCTSSITVHGEQIPATTSFA